MRAPAALSVALLPLVVILGLGAVSARAQTAAKPTFRDCAVCPLMTAIPAGRFQMGSPPTEAGRTAVEGPQHAVVIGYAFAVSTFDISRAEFATFASQTKFSVPDARCDWRAPRA